MKVQIARTCIRSAIRFISVLVAGFITTAVSAQVPSVVRLLSSPNPVAQGQLETFTAGVNWTANASPAGTITLTDTVTCPGSTTHITKVLGTIILGSAFSPSPGAGKLDVSSFPCTGGNLIVATYHGDANYAPGNSQALLVTVLAQHVPTRATLSASPNPATVGETITFSAHLAYTLTRNTHPVGEVTFTDRYSGKVLMKSAVITSGTGQEVVTAASFTTASLAAGSYAVQASYPGDGIYGPSSSSIVDVVVHQPTVENTSTALYVSPTQITHGAVVQLAAVVKAAAGKPTGAVSFYDGTALLARLNLSASEAIVRTSSLAVGKHPISAHYGGSASFKASVSATITVTVLRPPLTPTTTKLTSSGNPARVGQTIALVARVTAASGAPSGTVTFADHSTNPLTTLGSATVVNGVASINHTFSAGTHSLAAAYSGSGTFAASTGSLVEVVNTAAQWSTATSIASSSNPSSYGQAVTFIAKVSTAQGIATGTVTFQVGSTWTAVKLSDQEEAVFTTSALRSGSFSISAVYSGDATHGGSTSPLLGQGVLDDVILDVNGTGFVYDRVSKLFSSTLTVANNSGTAVAGPIQVLFTNLPDGVHVANATGTFNGAPYITLTNGLAEQQVISFPVEFGDPAMADITYQIHFYSGDF